jgi:hypothetical protein
MYKVIGQTSEGRRITKKNPRFTKRITNRTQIKKEIQDFPLDLPLFSI